MQISKLTPDRFITTLRTDLLPRAIAPDRFIRGGGGGAAAGGGAGGRGGRIIV